MRNATIGNECYEQLDNRKIDWNKHIVDARLVKMIRDCKSIEKRSSGYPEVKMEKHANIPLMKRLINY